MSSDRELLWEIHRQIEEHLGIGQHEPKSTLGTGRRNPDGIREVDIPEEPGIANPMRTIERGIQAQRSAKAGSAGAEEPSKPGE
jgi:hypothetical protein